jgi:hypothetical protein
LNNKIIQVYGGPYVGRMTYFSLNFNLKVDWELIELIILRKLDL